MTLAPWTLGDDKSRWNGYFLHLNPPVLRNKVGAETAVELSDAENDLFETRLAELRKRSPIPRSYDLQHLRSLHRYLFQDVYEWAGELRTVGLARGDGESFSPPLNIEQPVAHAAITVARTDLLRTIPDEDLADQVAYLYDYVNYAHPFREGNGRTQREFFTQLLAESGRTLDWTGVRMPELHDACHRARTVFDLEPLQRIFARIISRKAG